MENDTNPDLPLPTAFWGPVEGAPAPQPETVFDEYASWRESFAVHNITPEDAMVLYGGEVSVYLGGRQINTIEDIYKHLQCAAGLWKFDDIARPADDEEPKEPTRNEIRSEKQERRQARNAARDAHAQLVEEKRKAWKNAIQQRDQLMLQWNEYVERLHTEFKEARTAKI